MTAASTKGDIMFKRTRVKVILATVAAATAVVLATPVGTVLAEGPRIF